MSDGATDRTRGEDEVRFRTAASTLALDRFMTWFIKAGGLLIIVAVFAICAFILWQAAPLFRGARVGEAATVAGAPTDALALGCDEWGVMPFALGRDGALTFLPPRGELTRIATGLSGVSAASIDPISLRLAAGSTDGRVAIVAVRFDSSLVHGERTQKPSATTLFIDGLRQAAVVDISAGGSSEGGVVACVQRDGDGRIAVIAAVLGEASDGTTSLAPTTVVDLSSRIDGAPARVLVDERGERVLVANQHGYVWSFERDGDGFASRQAPFRPFADHEAIAAMGWLFGDQSLVFAGDKGGNCIYSIYVQDGGRAFGRTKELDPLPAGARAFAHGTRNKSFAVAAGSTVSLRYGTTAAVRWQQDVGYRPIAVAFNAKGDRVIALGDDGAVRAYPLDDPHPEAGLGAFFGKIWYEGASQPAYVWQSSSGNDDFEPKLSMMPLLFGTLKGTFYAMLFALPIALLGAMYTAEFMHPRVKRVVKPTLEIMASLPSVVLGFLAAQVLAPVLERRVPSVLAMVVLLPAAAIACGWSWSHLPPAVRAKLKPGWEWVAFLPVMLFVAWLAWTLGPVLDAVLFGGDFRTWWPRVTGSPYELRNSLVVGFMMGFAVIPIIFTIAEDALANVPKALRSASLALGGTRWQTAFRVVVPTASAGIFSALMIGLGRAIGETMIVVMATGNTPILDWNPFAGMRTITATIATELPEAAVQGTLFRTLFLGAVLLFALTFVVNTAAELLRQHLRQRYRTV